MKIFSVLAEFVLWELSIVSSLSLYSILVQHACNDRAWLTSDMMMLHVHKDRTDALTLVDVANDYVGEKENRKQLFGKFSVNDIPNKFYFVKVNTNRKLETRTKGIVDKCSDLTCTKKYALTEGAKRGKLMWATRSAPPVILCLLRACQ